VIKTFNKKHILLIVISFLILAVVFTFAWVIFDNTWRKAGTQPVLAFYNDEGQLVEIVAKSKEIGVIFSHMEHFYKDTIKISLEAANDDITAIYYTLDGSPPYSDSGIQYKGEIPVMSRHNRVTSYTLKVCGKKADDTFTSVQTHTYFVGEDIFERFDTLVFSLSTDPYNLYDYDYGIAIPGRLRDDYIKETGNKNPNPPEPANYNMRGHEAERPIYVELFDQNGVKILSQNAGVRIHGGWSRAANQKNFRLYARREYDEDNNTFDFDFFPDNFSYYGGAITSYKRLILRNNANDNPFAFLRDEVIQSMASTLLPDVQSHRPAAVYLNGRYYGFVWIKEHQNRWYLDDRNEIRNGEWVLLKGGAKYKLVDEEDPFEVQAAEDYKAVYDMRKNFKDDSVFAEFCSLVDIDNLLAYYAVQIYSNNGDWPRGNYKVYRYYGDEETRIHDGISTADGKWRWLLFDTDFGFGLYGTHATAKSLPMIMGEYSDERGNSPLFESLMRREDMRHRFTTIMCDIMNYHFEPDRIRNTVRRLEEWRMNELTFNFREGGAMLATTWSTLGFVAGEVERVIEFGYLRPEEMRHQLERYLNIPKAGYNVNVKAHDLADIRLNTIDITEDFQGRYYDVCDITLSAMIPDGFAFSHWLVNDKKRTETELLLGKDDTVSNRIDIELVLQADMSGIPVVNRIDHEGSSDYIVIYNPYLYDIDLRRFFLTTDSESDNFQMLADIFLKAGQSVKLYGRNYRSPDALGGFAMNFNLRNGETLKIIDLQGKEVFSYTLPRINNDHVLVRNNRTGKYVVEKRE